MIRRRYHHSPKSPLIEPVFERGVSNLRRGEEVTAFLSLLSFSKSAAPVALGLAPLQGLPLIMELFPSGQADLHLAPSLLPIECEGNQGHAAFGDGCAKLQDLPFMGEEFSRPRRGVIAVLCHLVFSNMKPFQKEFSILDNRIAIAKGDILLSKAFDLRPLENNATLQCLQNFIVVVGAAILENPSAFGIGGCRFPRHGAILC